MGNNLPCFSITKTVNKYKLMDQIYEVNEFGLVKDMVFTMKDTDGSRMKDIVKKNTSQKQVKYKLFRPKSSEQNMEDLLLQLSGTLLQFFDVKAIDIVSYDKAQSFIDDQQHKYVFIHIINDSKALTMLETDHIDVFFFINNTDEPLPQGYSILESFKKFQLIVNF